MSVIFTQEVRPERKPEVLLKGSTCNRAGYVPLQKQIEAFTRAGAMLRGYQVEYDFQGDEEDDGRNDPTRSYDFDVADAMALAKHLQAKREKAIAEAKAKEADKAKETPPSQPPAQTGSSGSPPPAAGT